MQYAILCYNDEDVVWSWSKQEDQAMMDRLMVVHERLVKEGKMGTSLRLLPTTAATTLRKGKGEEALVIDGPYAETKEQLLGFFLVDVETLDEALAIARELAACRTGSSYELRPVALHIPDQRAQRR